MDGGRLKNLALVKEVGSWKNIVDDECILYV